MDLTVLGFWGGYPWKGEGTSAYLLESEGFSLLIDAGSNTLTVLQEQLDPKELDAVIISHYHHDHVADLGVLQYYRQIRSRKEELAILPIYGHQEDANNFDGLTMAGVSQGYSYKETDELEIGPFDVTFLRTIHPVPCFAMRIVERKTDKALVYTADSGYLDKFEVFAKKADVLIADTYFLTGNEKHPVHFSAKEVGELAKNAEVETVILSHLQQELDLSRLKKEVVEITGEDISVLLANKNLQIKI